MGEDHDAFGADEDGALAGDFLGVADLGEDVGGRAFVAVVPDYFHSLAIGVLGAGEDVVDDGAEAPVVRGGGGAFGADAEGRGDADGFEDGVVDVAAHVAEGAGAEVEAFAPVAGMIVAAADEGAFGGDTEPEVPVEIRGHGIDAVGAGGGVAPGFVGPGVDFFDLADDAVLDHTHGEAVFGAGVDLDAHLSDELVVAGDFGEAAGFVDVVGEGFLAVHMFAQLEAGHADGGVHVVGRGDVDGVEVFLFVEEFAPVLVNLEVGIFLFQALGAGEVHVGDGDEFHVGLAGDGAEVRAGHATGAEAGVEQRAAGRGGDEVADEEGGGDAGDAELLEKGAAAGTKGGFHGAEVIGGGRRGKRGNGGKG